MDDARVPRPRASEKVSDVGTECDSSGGDCLAQLDCRDEDFSAVFVFLIMFLISSFCLRRISLLLHHSGLLYSQHRPRCLHALHFGLPSSHFFRRSRHVKHPTDPPVSHASYNHPSIQCVDIPDLDRLCILAASFLAASDMDDFEAGAGATAAGLVDEGAMEDISKVCDSIMRRRI